LINGAVNALQLRAGVPGLAAASMVIVHGVHEQRGVPNTGTFGVRRVSGEHAGPADLAYVGGCAQVPDGESGPEQVWAAGVAN